VAVNPQDGRVFVRDGRGLRINVYAPDGSFLERWPMTSPVSTGSPIQIRSDGLVLTPQVLDGLTDPGELHFGIVGFGPQGATGDTIQVPRYDYRDKWLTAIEEGGGLNASRIPFTPSVFWSFGPDGTIASGVGTSYRIEVRRPDSTILAIERQTEPVPVQPAERSWWEACTTAGLRLAQPGWAWNGPAIPTAKPLINDVFLDQDGRLWVRRPGPGVIFDGRLSDPYENPMQAFLHPYWGDIPTADLFDREGRYLGEVSLPKGIGWQPPMSPYMYVKGDLVIALVEGEDGTPTVRRYRLVVGVTP
jgi:hypothetical protein